MLTLSEIVRASDGTAWKTPTMRGYIFKGPTDANGDFVIGLQPASGSDRYDYTYTASTGKLTAPATPAPLDGQLLGLLMETNWLRATKAEYEGSRTDASAVW
jgi:hypothetical protein